MKRLLTLLFGLILTASFAVCAAAAETTEYTEATQVSTACEHSWNEGSVIPPTCVEPGELTSVCTLCNDLKITTIEPTGHSFDTIKDGDASVHIAVCSVCGGEESRAHSYDAGTETKPSDCTNPGEKVFACACGRTKTEAVDALGHDFSAWTKGEKNHIRSCSRCKEEESGAHTLKEETVKEATCKEAGEKKKTCTVCGFTVSEVVAKLTDHKYENACDTDCDVCGEARNTKHNYGKSWSRDYSGHWHECTKCGEKTDFKKHYPGPAATEEEPQVCLTCDYVLTEQLDHKHDTGKTWTSDETGHWHACKGCEEQVDFKKHDYDNACDETCNICDYKNESAHDLKDGWQTTDKKHWMECTICGKKLEHENHIPGPAATEENAQVCTVCDYELEARLEHTHDFGYLWLYDGEKHWQECACGEKSVPHPHNWDEGTKGKGGSMYYTCADCLAHRTEEGSGFPWWILIVILLLLGGGGAAVYFLYIVPGKSQGNFLDELSGSLNQVEEEDAAEDASEDIPGEIQEDDLDSILKEFSDI